MSIHAVIWDLGGVLVRTEDFTPRDILAQRFGLTTGELSNLVFGDNLDFRAQLGEITAEEQWENIRSNLGVDAEEIPSIRAQFFAGDRLDNNLMDYIRSLKSNFTTVLLSNALDSLRDLIIDEWKIEDAFHHLIISAEVGLMKPGLEIYCLAVEKTGCEPEEVVFIDDMPENIIGARDVGMHAILFQNAAQARADLEELLANEKDQR